MIQIKIGDCSERLKDLEDNSVDAIICDPPYGLKFMSKGWDDIGDGAQQREWHRRWLSQAYRVLKPSGVLKAFSGTRTFHHLLAVMEEVGFSRLSCEAWTYGSGFPKSYNIGTGIDDYLGVESRVTGMIAATGTARKSTNKGGHGATTSNIEGRDFIETNIYSKEPSSEEGMRWKGWGSNLKPAWEPVCIGYKGGDNE